MSVHMHAYALIWHMCAGNVSASYLGADACILLGCMLRRMHMQTHRNASSVGAYACILKRARMESYLAIFRAEDDAGAQTHNAPR
jgi:hypothetical protein